MERKNNSNNLHTGLFYFTLSSSSVFCFSMLSVGVFSLTGSFSSDPFTSSFSIRGISSYLAGISASYHCILTICKIYPAYLTF